MTTHSNLERVLAQLLIGDSPAMRRLRADIMSIADTRLPVLIQGPTGAGKELVAEGLHLASVRCGQMVAFNVCAVSDTMFEDALFGHVRGAFTGAQSDAPGYLLEADRGTLFLDEIGGLSMTAQAKLLRAIETRRFRPVGARADRSSDFRLISATNEPLSALVSAHRFRLDLAHRLGAVVLEVPALGDRLDDVPLLAKHFARETNGEESHQPVLAADALDRLQGYCWPGNVRQLRHVVEHAVARARGGEWITAAEIAVAMPTAAPVESGISTAGETSLSRYRLVRELERFDWRIAETAQSLGVHRVTVFRRMRHLGIVPPAGGRSRDHRGRGGRLEGDVSASPLHHHRLPPAQVSLVKPRPGSCPDQDDPDVPCSWFPPLPHPGARRLAACCHDHAVTAGSATLGPAGGPPSGAAGSGGDGDGAISLSHASSETK